jgi:hypothetical protein
MDGVIIMVDINYKTKIYTTAVYALPPTGISPPPAGTLYAAWSKPAGNIPYKKSYRKAA